MLNPSLVLFRSFVFVCVSTNAFMLVTLSPYVLTHDEAFQIRGKARYTCAKCEEKDKGASCMDGQPNLIPLCVNWDENDNCLAYVPYGQECTSVNDCRSCGDDFKEKICKVELELKETDVCTENINHPCMPVTWQESCQPEDPNDWGGSWRCKGYLHSNPSQACPRGAALPDCY